MTPAAHRGRPSRHAGVIATIADSYGPRLIGLELIGERLDEAAIREGSRPILQRVAPSLEQGTIAPATAEFSATLDRIAKVGVDIPDAEAQD